MGYYWGGMALVLVYTYGQLVRVMIEAWRYSIRVKLHGVNYWGY